MAHESEKETRKRRIDTRLRRLSPPWEVVPYAPGMDASALDRVAVEEWPTQSGPVDYALFVNGRLLGLIEAKRLGVGAENVLEQAKRYSRSVWEGAGRWGDYHVPFLYASNGEETWFVDVRDGEAYSRRVSGFHSAPALEEMFSREPRGDWFARTPISDARLRPYQVAAIEHMEEALGHGKRNMLLAMATGTGKTYMTVAQIHRLLESKQFRRVLFLVDRRALAAQAVAAFTAYETPHRNKFTQEYEVYHQQFRREDLEETERPFDASVLPNEYLSAPKASQTFVYVCTIQRMAINLFGHERAFAQDASDPEFEEDERVPVAMDAFDVVIADECHRGYRPDDVGVWRAVLEHFDAVKIGLTATPAPHTTMLFGAPVFRYTTEQAIRDGFLCDYEAVSISSDVRMQGVFLREGEQVGMVDTESGQERLDLLEDERKFDSSEVERRITAPDSNRKIVAEIAKYARAHEEATGRFPKTLIFACNDLPHVSHADRLVALCREEFAHGDDFVQKITGSATVDRPLQRIREFRNRRQPRVVVTVDMLSTGVDIPELEFIVFLRPVKSRILWTQMLGRGTRLCPDIGKTHFTAFDCFAGTLIEYFRDTTDFFFEPPGKATVSTPEVIEKIWQNEDRDYWTRVLAKRLRRIDANMSGEARDDFAKWGIAGGDVGAFADSLAERVARDFAATMALLRDAEFQRLLDDYQRAKRPFTVAYGALDTVDSAYLFRVGDGHVRAEDYLEAFARFVRDNEGEIEALRVLLGHPDEWRPEVLKELRETLAGHDFPEEGLRHAHWMATGKAMADIISMVKHAAVSTSPLLSAEERVDAAMAKVTYRKSLSDEQLQWLGYIRDHLAENLSIDLDDFDAVPVLYNRGGLAKARRVFTADGLQRLVDELNMAVAA